MYAGRADRHPHTSSAATRIALTSRPPRQTTRDQRRDVRKNSRQHQASRRREIPRLPQRIELLLVESQTLEVVKRFSAAEKQRADAIPEGCQASVLDARERRHSEVEPLIAILLSPEHQLDEQK